MQKANQKEKVKHTKEDTLKIDGSLEDVLKASFPKPKDKKPK